jgi:hypothetical protein
LVNPVARTISTRLLFAKQELLRQAQIPNRSWAKSELGAASSLAPFFDPETPFEGAMIAQDFEFTGDFPIERNTEVYCRLRKNSCGFKRPARARRLMGFPGLKACLIFKT